MNDQYLYGKTKCPKCNNEIEVKFDGVEIGADIVNTSMKALDRLNELLNTYEFEKEQIKKG